MSSLDAYRTRLVAIDPAIAGYFAAGTLDTLSGLRVAASKARQWAAGEGADIAALDQLIADLEAPAETTTTVTITPVAEATELYHHESGQPSPQEVKMHLDIATGALSTAFVPYGDEHSIPESVYHHRGALWTIPCLTMDAANRLLSEVAPIAQRIIDGTEIEWDGVDNVGTYDTDAAAAIAEVAALIETYDDPADTIQELSGDEYYDDGPDAARETLGITTATTDDDLARITEEAAADALTCRVVVPDLRDYLDQLREDLRDQLREELEEVAGELARLTERRDALICRQLAWGDTTRDVGTRAGMTHVGVQKVRDRAAS